MTWVGAATVGTRVFLTCGYPGAEDVIVSRECPNDASVKSKCDELVNAAYRIVAVPRLKKDGDTALKIMTEGLA